MNTVENLSEKTGIRTSDIKQVAEECPRVQEDIKRFNQDENVDADDLGCVIKLALIGEL